MRLTFVQPALLLLLLLLVPVWAIALYGMRAPGRRPARWRVYSALLLRTAMLTALVAALAGAQIVRAAPQMTTVFVLDSSDSVSPAARARAEAYIGEALRAMPEGDRAAVVVFGAEAIVERPPSAERQLVRLRVAPDSSATDIGGALRLALAAAPADSQRRLVLLSDGAETTFAPGSSALEVAAQARALGVPVDVVGLAGPPPAEDVALEAVEAPANAREGQKLQIVVQARSARDTPARLQLLRDRQPVLDTSVDLKAGTNRLPLEVEAPRGFHTWEARLEAPDDGVAANDVGFAFTEVRGPPQILLVASEPDRAANLESVLRGARLEPRIIAPAELPTTLAGLDVWDAVVLVDVPFRALPEQAARLLPAYVRELGRGLMMVGGEDSYAAGGYVETPVEQALPVSMRTRGAEIRPDVALVLVIDRSGSMSGEKLSLAKEGAAQAYGALEEDDQVGLIAFDTDASWTVDLQRKPPADVFLDALGGVGEGGGTNLRPGFELAAEALERAEAKIKHVVMLTDGQADRNYDDVVDRLKQGGITLSTVGIGEEYDPHLRVVAPATGGRFYEALNFADIPQLLFDETIRIARRGIVEETFTPLLGSGPLNRSAAVRDLRAAPPLHGYNATTPRDTALVALAAPNGDPILAEWQYGLGRAAAWTSDMKGQWARDWIAWDGFGSFAAQLVASLVSPPLSEGYETRTAIAGASLNIELRGEGAAASQRGPQRVAARLLMPDGAVTETPLVEREPGRFLGGLSRPAPGVYRVQVVTTDAAGVSSIVATSGAVVPPSAEYLRREGDPGLLRAIALATGGRVDLPAGEAWARPPLAARRAAPFTWPLLWLAALLLPIDIAVRRLLLPRPAVVFPSLARRLRPQAPVPGRPAVPRRAQVLQEARRRAGAGLSPTAGSDREAGTTPAGPASQERTGARVDNTAGEAPPAVRARNWRDSRRSLPERPGEQKGRR